MFSGGVLNREPTIFRGLSAYDCARQTLKSSFDVILQKNLPGRQEKVGSFDDKRYYSFFYYNTHKLTTAANLNIINQKIMKPINFPAK